MNAHFLSLTAKITSLFLKNNGVGLLPKEAQSAPDSITNNTASQDSPIERHFFTQIPESVSLLIRYQTAKQEYLPVLNLVPIEGQDILTTLENDFSKIANEKLNIQHRLRLKNLTELVLPRIFKEYTHFKAKKTDNGIPADTYFIENLKIAARQVKDVLLVVQQNNNLAKSPGPRPQY